jgi:hypothetical protein
MRVASVPAAHPYIAGLGLERAGADLLVDPPVPGAPAGRWWPPVMLDPEWIAANAGRFDVMHVHFGMESSSVAGLARTVAALRAAGRPLVHTVHDLTHPQLDDQARHRAQLDTIIAAADALVTLTPGAAAEIERRWGRRPLVLAHPAMRAPGPAPAPAARGDGSGPVIGMQLRDLRPNIDGPGACRTLVSAVARLRDGGVPAQVRVTMHDHVRDPAAREQVRRELAGVPCAGLHETPRPPDRELEAELAGCAINVLPYRHGTHSGWLELCWDLGVPVAAPRVGHLADQHPEPGFLASFARGDADSLARALRALLDAPESVAGGAARRRTRRRREGERRTRDRELAAAHVDLYRRLSG